MTFYCSYPLSGDTVSSPCMCAKWHDYQVVDLIDPSYWLAMWNLHVRVRVTQQFIREHFLVVDRICHVHINFVILLESS